MRGIFSIMIRTVKAVMLLALLSVYMVSAIRVNTLHELLHDDTHAITHLEKDESDGCHRAIYHNDKQGCSHKTHIVQHTDCQACDFIANADIVLSAGKITGQHNDLSLEITNYVRVSPDTQQSLLPARGPPFC
jgi:hypothetical protein